MNLKEIGNALLHLRDVDIISFDQYGHHSNVVLQPVDLVNPDNDWITTKIHSIHMEIRNNMCTVHIGYYEDTEIDNKKYSKDELEELFWKDALNEEDK